MIRRVAVHLLLNFQKKLLPILKTKNPQNQNNFMVKGGARATLFSALYCSFCNARASAGMRIPKSSIALMIVAITAVR